MVSNLTLAIFLVFVVWLSIISLLIWNLISHYNKLTKGVTNKSLKSVLENLLKDNALTKKDIDYLKEYSNKIQKEGLFHIQKVGLVRFNPFKDTGGEQSFILSLIDGNNTGVVISGLYSRSGTRWYAKKVVNGRGVEYDLSEEEKKALKEASESNFVAASSTS